MISNKQSTVLKIGSTTVFISLNYLSTRNVELNRFIDETYVLEVSYGADLLKAHPVKAELRRLKLSLNSSDDSSIMDQTTKKVGEKDESC